MSQRIVVFAVFLFAYFLSYFFRTANAVIAEDLVRDLGLSADALGLMTSLFFATFSLVQLPLGAALDRFGARYVTPALMLSGVLGGLIFAAAPSFAWLALGRALIGLGTAGILMGSLQALSSWFDPARFASIFGMFVGLGALGGLMAGTPLVLLKEALGWRMVFAAGAGVFLLSALLVWGLGRNKAGGLARSSPKADEPGSFRDIFRSLLFWRIALMNFSMTAALFAYQGLWAGPYLLEAQGLSSVVAGNVLLVLAAGVVTGFFIGGQCADRFGLSRVLTGSCVLFIAVQLAFALFSQPWPPLLLALGWFIFGLTGSCSLLCLPQVRRVFPPAMTGRAVTAVNFFGIGGSALLQWWLGLLIARFPLTASGTYPVEAYQAAFVLSAALNIVALLMYLPMLKPQQQVSWSS